MVEIQGQVVDLLSQQERSCSLHEQGKNAVEQFDSQPMKGIPKATTRAPDLHATLSLLLQAYSPTTALLQQERRSALIAARSSMSRITMSSVFYTKLRPWPMHYRCRKLVYTPRRL
ncbi:hypothetical protein SESBI_10685 [Sesbania bispinosa]|nr:hypothetical protein SESBI_10685 [Sesbania bispinosa]